MPHFLRDFDPNASTADALKTLHESHAALHDSHSSLHDKLADLHDKFSQMLGHLSTIANAVQKPEETPEGESQGGPKNEPSAASQGVPQAPTEAAAAQT